MKVQFSIAMLLCVGIVCLGVLSGCDQKSKKPSPKPKGEAGSGGAAKAEIDPHDVPLTEEQKKQMREENAKFSDAVAKVKQLRDAIEKETKDGIPKNPFEAHQALDKADFFVPLLPEIASKSDVPKEHWEVINTAANELRESFDQIHQNIDNKVDPGFTAVKEKIDANIAELEATFK